MLDKRKTFKALKQQKLFGKFCLTMATAYKDQIYPRQKVEEYFKLAESLGSFSLIEAVKKWDLGMYLDDSQIKAIIL